MTRTVYVDVVSSGLDQRVATRSAYFDITVPAWGSVPLSVPMSVWPIRGVGIESDVYLKLREYVAGTGETGFVDYTTERRYEMNSSYTTVTLHGIQGKDLDRVQPPAASTTAQWWSNLDAAKGDLRNLVGMIWNGSAFVELAGFSPQPNGAKGEYVLRGQLVVDLNNLLSSFVVNYVPSGNVQTYTMCPRWRAKFIDAAIGSKLTTTDHQASRAWGAIRVFTCGGVCPWIAWVGQLDANGCTPPLQIEAGLYLDIITDSYLKNDTTGATALVKFGANTISNTGIHGKDYTAAMRSDQLPMAGGPLDFPTTTEDFNTRAAAVVGRAMGMQDDGFEAFTTYNVNTNTGCVGQVSFRDQLCKAGEACGTGQELNIGWVLTPSQSATADCGPPTGLTFFNRSQKHNTQYKAVIAHELGHCIQSTLQGSISPPASQWNVKKPDLPPFQCTCDFVQEGNQIHCMQSREPQRIGITEGYGHFYSSRVTNDLTQGPCSYPYYKTVAKYEFDPWLSSFTWRPKAPPQSVTCTGPAYNGAGWMDDQCKTNGSLASLANRGTEWDWTTFLYDVSRPGASGIPLGDPSGTSAGLARVWRNACNNGDWGRACSTLNPTFLSPNVSGTMWFVGVNGGQGLRDSVIQLASGMNPHLFPQQRDNFLTLGTQRGVDH